MEEIQQEELQVTEVPQTEVVEEPSPALLLSNEALSVRIAELEQLLLQAMAPKPEEPKLPKNKVAAIPAAGRVYIRLADDLGKVTLFPKIPQQQADIANILKTHMELGKQYSEAEVFEMVVEHAAEFKQLANSVQHPTYLFRYYRNLAPGNKHAGFVARNFLRYIDPQ